MKTLIKRYLREIAAVTVIAAILPGAALAAANAVVEAVQSPAWIERNGTRIPIAPGMPLQDRDQVHTGANSRVLLRMPEGSTVKLGENARFAIDRQDFGRGNVYTAAMSVAEGAFRFTSDVFTKFRGRRDINVKLITVTAGIRGTDLWGKSDRDREIVCLIDGRIAVQRGAEAPIAMSDPLSFYIAPAGKEALPVAPVPPEQLKQWAMETEIEVGKGGARRGGQWKVMLAEVATQAEALLRYDALRDAGYAARIVPAHTDKERRYEVLLSNLPSQQDAQALANALRGKYGVTEAVVRR